MMQCAVNDHRLVDGVLVEDMAIVGFIRKRVPDFRKLEKVCRKCKEKITEIYRKKMKRAIALNKSRLRDSSLPTISSSSHSTVENGSHMSKDSFDRCVAKTPKHAKMKRTNKTESSTTSLAITPSSSLLDNMRTENIQQMGNSISYMPAKTPQNAKNTIPRHSRLSEQPTTSKTATTSGVSTLRTNVTIRKRIITDYLEAKSADTPPSKRICVDSERPTTSKAAAAAASKVHITGSDEDEPRYSLNAFNGTRLPNIQPMPPKRIPRTDLSPAQLAMLEYAKDITGG